MTVALLSEPDPAAIDTATGSAPWLAAIIAAASAYMLIRALRHARDRALTDTLESLAYSIFGFSLSIVLLGLAGGSTFATICFLVGLGTSVVMLIVAVPAARFLDKRNDKRRREALNLAPRRRLLEPRTLIFLWCVGGFAAFMLFMIIATFIALAAFGTGTPTPRNVTDIIAICALAFIGLLVAAASFHVKVVQPEKIRAEDERLRQLDLQQWNTGEPDSGVAGETPNSG